MLFKFSKLIAKRKRSLFTILGFLLSYYSVIFPMQNQGNPEGKARAIELGYTAYLLTNLKLQIHIVEQITEYLKNPLPILSHEQIGQLLQNLSVPSITLPAIGDTEILQIAYQEDGTLCIGGKYINKIYSYKPHAENWEIHPFTEEKFKGVPGRACSGDNLPLDSKLRHPGLHFAPKLIAQHPTCENLTLVKANGGNANICICNTESGDLLNNLKIECEDFALSHDGKYLACLDKRYTKKRSAPEPETDSFFHFIRIMDNVKFVVSVHVLHLEEFLNIKQFLENLNGCKLILEHHYALADCLDKQDQEIDYAKTAHLIQRILAKLQYQVRK